MFRVSQANPPQKKTVLFSVRHNETPSRILNHTVLPQVFPLRCVEITVNGARLDRPETNMLYMFCIHISHTIHVWYIYLHLVDFYGTCREIYQPHGSYRYFWFYPCPKILRIWPTPESWKKITRAKPTTTNSDGVCEFLLNGWKPRRQNRFFATEINWRCADEFPDPLRVWLMFEAWKTLEVHQAFIFFGPVGFCEFHHFFRDLSSSKRNHHHF